MYTPQNVYKQLRMKDLPKVPTWRLVWDSNQQPSAPNTATQPPRPWFHGIVKSTINTIEFFKISTLIISTDTNYSNKSAWLRMWPFNQNNSTGP